MAAAPRVKLVWGLAVAVVAAGVLPACGPARRPSVHTRSAAPPPPVISSVAQDGPITQVVLERVGGGPQFDWQTERLVLLRPDGSDPRASAQFARLSDWLPKSGFFSRPSGYVDPQSLFPTDVGHLMIKATRGGRVWQVWSYNGQRDDELWETETMIRGTDAALRRYHAEVARIGRWNRLHAATGGP